MAFISNIKNITKRITKKKEPKPLPVQNELVVPIPRPIKGKVTTLNDNQKLVDFMSHLQDLNTSDIIANGLKKILENIEKKDSDHNLLRFFYLLWDVKREEGSKLLDFHDKENYKDKKNLIESLRDKDTKGYDKEFFYKRRLEICKNFCKSFLLIKDLFISRSVIFLTEFDCRYLSYSFLSKQYLSNMNMTLYFINTIGSIPKYEFYLPLFIDMRKNYLNRIEYHGKCISNSIIDHLKQCKKLQTEYTLNSSLIFTPLSENKDNFYHSFLNVVDECKDISELQDDRYKFIFDNILTTTKMRIYVQDCYTLINSFKEQFTEDKNIEDNMVIINFIIKFCLKNEKRPCTLKHLFDDISVFFNDDSDIKYLNELYNSLLTYSFKNVSTINDVNKFVEFINRYDNKISSEKFYFKKRNLYDVNKIIYMTLLLCLSYDIFDKMEACRKSDEIVKFNKQIVEDANKVLQNIDYLSEEIYKIDYQYCKLLLSIKDTVKAKEALKVKANSGPDNKDNVKITDKKGILLRDPNSICTFTTADFYHKSNGKDNNFSKVDLKNKEFLDAHDSSDGAHNTFVSNKKYPLTSNLTTNPYVARCHDEMLTRDKLSYEDDNSNIDIDETDDRPLSSYNRNILTNPNDDPTIPKLAPFKAL